MERVIDRAPPIHHPTATESFFAEGCFITGTVRQLQPDDPGDEQADRGRPPGAGGIAMERDADCERTGRADAGPHGKEVPDIRWLKKNQGTELFEKDFRSVSEKSASPVSNSRIYDANF